MPEVHMSPRRLSIYFGVGTHNCNIGSVSFEVLTPGIFSWKKKALYLSISPIIASLVSSWKSRKTSWQNVKLNYHHPTFSFSMSYPTWNGHHLWETECCVNINTLDVLHPVKKSIWASNKAMTRHGWIWLIDDREWYYYMQVSLVHSFCIQVSHVFST